MKAWRRADEGVRAPFLNQPPRRERTSSRPRTGDGSPSPSDGVLNGRGFEAGSGAGFGQGRHCCKIHQKFIVTILPGCLWKGVKTESRRKYSRLHLVQKPNSPRIVMKTANCNK